MRSIYDQCWSQHLYSYTGNNPVNYIDPTGHVRINNERMSDGGKYDEGNIVYEDEVVSEPLPEEDKNWLQDLKDKINSPIYESETTTNEGASGTNKTVSYLFVTEVYLDTLETRRLLNSLNDKAGIEGIISIPLGLANTMAGTLLASHASSLYILGKQIEFAATNGEVEIQNGVIISIMPDFIGQSGEYVYTVCSQGLEK